MNGQCERCKQKSNTTTCSFFNTDMICPTCEGEEKNHPQYQRAVEVERGEVEKGNMNYEGIGLPNDLKPKTT